MKYLSVIGFVIAVGCTIGEVSTKPPNGALTAGRCETTSGSYAECVADVTEEQDTCYAGCVQDGIECAVDAALGFITSQLPCVGPVLDSLLTGCAFCAKEPADKMLGCAGKCVLGIYDTYFRDFDKFKRDIAQCAGGASDDLLRSLANNFKQAAGTALAEGAACALAFGVCTSADTTLGIPLGSCDTTYVAGIDACETVQCNPAFCTCFDAQECPTIGGGASRTHMTGTVSCDSISVGRGTTATGDEVTCVSYTNNADTSTCTETGWNGDGTFGGRGRFEACDSDAHCGDVLQCMDYDCDGKHHCDFSNLGGPGNCCDHPGGPNVGCQTGYACVDSDGDAIKHCTSDGSGSGSGSDL